VQRTLLIILVAASYLLLAGGRPWTLAPLLTIAAAAALLTPSRTFSFNGPCRALDLGLIALLIAIALQVAPLPSALVAIVSPHHDEVATAIRLAPFENQHPFWTTLSIDPPATLLSLAAAALGVLTFWVARATFSAGGSTRTFCRALTFFATLVAVTALLQKAVSPRSILFVVEPELRNASPFGAFVNRNHFGGWLLLVAAPVVGYFVARRRIHPSRRGRWRESIGEIMSSGILFTAIAVMGIVGVLLLTLSRSAMVGLAAAALTGGWLGRSRLHLERTTLPGVLSFVGAVLLIVMVFVDVDSWSTRIAHSLEAEGSALGRLAIWRESLPMARDFWITGTGAGTYSSAMNVYQQSRVWVGSMQQWARINNAHSHYLQVICEGGLLIALPAFWSLLALARLGYRAVRADKGEMFWVRVGAAAGLAGVAVQSIWEISLIMPANAVMAGVLGALLLYRRDGRGGDATTTTPATPDVLTPPVRMART
jgi:O-antigen ligase